MRTFENEIGRNLVKWFKENKRDLPWRKTKDPYRIWLSEVIMQQTQIIQGTDYYLKFEKKYPKIEDLANAKEEEVFKLWEGLGYYSRAKNLHFTAKYILHEYKGVFPVNYDEVIGLKGVGKYTAAAICSIAYGQKYAVVDGNVIRVITRYIGIKEEVDKAKTKDKIEKYALEFMCNNNPGVFNESLMELGSIICKPRQPLCKSCILKEGCFALNENMILSLPVKRQKAKVKTRFFYYNVILTNKGVLINKREEKDIWRGLYEFPLLEEGSKNVSVNKIKKRIEYKTKLKLINVEISKWYEQKLTHQKVFSRFYIWEGKEPLFDANKKYNFVRVKDLNKIAFPRTIIWFLDENAIHLNSFNN